MATDAAQLPDVGVLFVSGQIPLVPELMRLAHPTDIALQSMQARRCDGAPLTAVQASKNVVAVLKAHSTLNPPRMVVLACVTPGVDLEQAVRAVWSTRPVLTRPPGEARREGLGRLPS